MYYGSEGLPKNTWEEDEKVGKARGSPVKVVSFDLDDTVWSTGGSIQSANADMDEWMKYRLRTLVSEDKGVPLCWSVMRSLATSQVGRYCDLELVEGGKEPEAINLTLLRTDALRVIHRHVTEGKGGDEDVDFKDLPEDEEGERFAKEGFSVWHAGRHSAIVSHLAVDALETIEYLKGLGVVVGTITNGNSEPDLVEGWEGVFDFHVKSEDIGVGKPSRSVFDRAVEEGRKCLGGEGGDMGEVGGWWVHVGDDLVKDCVAGKGMGMRTVWVKEFLNKKEKEGGDVHVTGKDNFDGRGKGGGGGGGGEMEGFLSEGIRDDFVDEEVEMFRDLTGLIKGWMEEWEEGKGGEVDEQNEGGEGTKVGSSMGTTIDDLLRSANVNGKLETFLSNGIDDIQTARELADDDLKELGLNLGERKRLMKKLEEI